MKKNSVIIILLVVIVVFGVFSFIDRSQLVESNNQLTLAMSESEKELRQALELKDNQLTINEIGEKADALRYEESIAELEEKIAFRDKEMLEYENVIETLSYYVHGTQAESTKRLYSYKTKVITDNSEFPIPSNGVIPVETTSLTVEIEIERPYYFAKTNINQLIHKYNVRFAQVQAFQGGSKEYTDNSIVIKYEDLKVGDEIEVVLPQELSSLLELDTYKLLIEVTDEFEDVSAYMPENIYEITYNYNGDPELYIWRYKYLSETSYEVSVLESEHNYKTVYDYNDGLTKTVLDPDGNVSGEPIVLLPKIIQLGDTWSHYEFKYQITGVDIPINTYSGIELAVQVAVTQGSGDEITHWSNEYYTKKYGETKIEDEYSFITVKDVKYIE